MWSSCVCLLTYVFANSGKPNHTALPTLLSRKSTDNYAICSCSAKNLHSGSLPVQRRIICTLWGCEHLKWIQILCSSNAIICGSSGNMQVFLKLQSWLWGWIIIFDRSFLSDITLGKAQFICMTCCLSNKCICLLWYRMFPRKLLLPKSTVLSPHPISSLLQSNALKVYNAVYFPPKSVEQ